MSSLMTQDASPARVAGATLDKRRSRALATWLQEEWKDWIPQEDGAPRPEDLLRALVADGPEHAERRRRAILKQEIWRLLVTACWTSSGHSEAIHRVESILPRIEAQMKELGLEEGRARALRGRLWEGFEEVRDWPLR